MSASTTSAAATASASLLPRHAVSALEEIDECSPIYKRPCIDMLCKILAAVCTAPQDAKYRRLNVGKLRPKLRTDAALKLLESLGFLPTETAAGADEFLVMADTPKSEQIALMQEVQSQLRALISADASRAGAAAASAASAAASGSSSVAPHQLRPEEGDTIEDATHVLFWRPPAWGCQWTMTDFVMDGVRYLCPEQAMMAGKARLFGDHKTFARIMTTSGSREHKKLGRQVTPFDAKTWDDHALQLVTDINYAKFTQHTAFAERLLATGNKIIVEATPYDCVWGVGMMASDPDIRDQTKWQGTNLLGVALMAVRDRLRRERKA